MRNDVKNLMRGVHAEDRRILLRSERSFRGVLARCERAYVKFHKEEALEEAVRICSGNCLPQRQWMVEALARLKTLEILKKKKHSRPTDWIRDHTWFTTIQGYRDEYGPRRHGSLKYAINQTLDLLDRLSKENSALFEVKSRLSDQTRGKYGVLKQTYERHKKLVRRANIPAIGPCWVPRDGINAPRLLL